ncbi:MULTISPECIES: helix-turn-helix domain-containing protein [unclassified Anabaena]|uniref:helix-turn-helix domain-containing protein n=1 Tax=unclassified Anabaena TaxID=2619674 RepID=UPI000831B163|nr:MULTISPECIES: helix-turn-helix domain-containing protein [unclassified Anabaena]
MSEYQLQNHQGKYLTPFQRKLLEKSLQENISTSYRQRLEIMLLADEGKSQTVICRKLGCSPATVRHWMHIARAGIAHQWQDCPIGRPKTVNDQYMERLRELVNSSPRDYGYSFTRWTANALEKHLAKELGIEISDRHIKRLLKQMGLSTIPRKNQPQNNNQINSGKIAIDNLESANIPENPDLFPFISTTLEA